MNAPQTTALLARTALDRAESASRAGAIAAAREAQSGGDELAAAIDAAIANEIA